jgi:uncharacterized protein with PIN domain
MVIDTSALLAVLQGEPEIEAFIAAIVAGDCFSYALSVSSGEPLLFKGDDFGRTDVRPGI